MKIIGIDPGLHGGIAVIHVYMDPLTQAEKMDVQLYPTPLIGDKEYDIQSLKNMLGLHADATLACIERQQSIAGQGLVSTFKTGYGFGIYLGLLGGLNIRYDVVQAQRWQRQLFVGLKHGQDTKVSSEIVAKRLFPFADFRKSERAHKAHDGLTDAACIAEFARRTMRRDFQSFPRKNHVPNPDNENVCLDCGAWLAIADEQCVAIHKETGL